MKTTHHIEETRTVIGPKHDIVITGAREHNLKNIALTLPRDKLIVITGLSGSGKSSLAFDTIYAEGQRRYVESLSAYARQFLGQMDKPDVDYIEGLSPAISIEQKTTSPQPALDRRHRHRDLRLPAPALRAHRRTRTAPTCGTARSRRRRVQQIVDPVLRAGRRARALQRGRPGGARPQGRVRQALRTQLRAGRLRARARRRRGARARRGRSSLRQEVQARHRGRRRPAGRAGRPAAAAGRLRRDRRSSSATASSMSSCGRRRATLACSARSSPASDCGISLPEIDAAHVLASTARTAPAPPATASARPARSTRTSIVPDGSISIAEGALLPYGQLRRCGWIEQVIVVDRRDASTSTSTCRGTTCPRSSRTSSSTAPADDASR